MYKKLLVCCLLGAVASVAARADVSIVEQRHVGKMLGGQPKSGDKKHSPPTKATGSQGLIDNSGLKYFINTNITFSTTSSASGAMSEASYTHAVAATTLNGGTTSSTLNDAFDGYNTLCLSLNNTVANCATGNPNFEIYNKEGPATTECLGATSGVNRQVVFPVSPEGVINVQRKVFVPDNDSFARWMNYFTNTSGAPVTVTAVIANNLGSDSNTQIVTSSNGNATAEVTDTWISSFQAYSGTTSSDVRLAHVLQGAGAGVPMTGINFVDGDDNPFWGYTFTLNPGETKIVVNFVVGQPNKAAANAKATTLATATPWTGAQAACMTPTEMAQVANFSNVNAVPVVTIPTMGGIGLGVLALALLAGSLWILRRRAQA